MLKFLGLDQILKRKIKEEEAQLSLNQRIVQDLQSNDSQIMQSLTRSYAHAFRLNPTDIPGLDMNTDQFIEHVEFTTQNYCAWTIKGYKGRLLQNFHEMHLCNSLPGDWNILSDLEQARIEFFKVHGPKPEETIAMFFILMDNSSDIKELISELNTSNESAKN